MATDVKHMHHPSLAAWARSTVYSIGNRVANGGNAYQCITAGTSASSGPSGAGSSISDGSVVWKFLSSIDFTSLSSFATYLTNTYGSGLTNPVELNVWNDAEYVTSAGFPPLITWTVEDALVFLTDNFGTASPNPPTSGVVSTGTTVSVVPNSGIFYITQIDSANKRILVSNVKGGNSITSWSSSATGVIPLIVDLQFDPTGAGSGYMGAQGMSADSANNPSRVLMAVRNLRSAGFDYPALQTADTNLTNRFNWGAVSSYVNRCSYSFLV